MTSSTRFATAQNSGRYEGVRKRAVSPRVLLVSGSAIFRHRSFIMQMGARDMTFSTSTRSASCPGSFTRSTASRP